MDTLPPEIIAQIVEKFTEDQKLAPFSTISRVWKASVERLTFKSLSVATSDLDELASLFNGDNISRRAALTSLRITVILPNPGNAMGCCPVVRTIDRAADSTAFSEAVVKLFSILADLEARATAQPPLSLAFPEGVRPSRTKEPHGSTKVPCMPGYGNHQHSRREVRETKAKFGQFELLHETAIPTVYSVETLDFLGYHDLSDLKLTWISAIVPRLPKLRKLILWRTDEYGDGRRKRVALRDQLSASLLSLAGEHLREIRIDVRHEPVKNEAMPVHKLVDSNQWSQESWFKVFNHLATFPNLAVLHLLGGLVICPQFFRGIIDQPRTPFPALVDFELQFAPDTANGNWFYLRDDEAIESSRSDPEYEEFWEEKAKEDAQREDDRHYHSDSSLSDDGVRVFEEEPVRTNVVDPNVFRTLPDTTTFLPFLTDAAKVVLRIPNLRKFVLKQGHKFSDYTDPDYFPIVSRVFELWYLKAGMPRSPKTAPTHYDPSVPGDTAYVDQNRLYWRVDRWKLWDEVEAAWNDIAGPDAKVVFLEEEKWTTYGGWRDHQIYEGNF
ncbi:hypothetical protein CC86DRAFT_468004 [Ophiobolus disseminans]|uniref:F-box domain-containing protein n=1 Tax=Ophiobolus disseminans TaxID=1469910 RepID=A0A6A6ZWG1_9PLEO|nr:hypothetical protein CC86DRAFT_468004 [Ophiobolus disseminans]